MKDVYLYSIISLLQYTYCILPVQVPFARVPRFVGTLPVGATSRCLSAPAKQSPTPSTLPAIFHRRPLLLLIYSLLTHCQFTLSFDIEIIVRATSNRKPFILLLFNIYIVKLKLTTFFCYRPT